MDRQIKIWIISIHLAALVICYPVVANAAELLGLLRKNHDDAFAGYYYRTYELSPKQGTSFRFALKSEDFDAYLFLISPDGKVLSNDEASTSARPRGDAEIVVDNALGGRWIAIATSFERDKVGRFKLTFNEGLATKRVTLEANEQRQVLIEAFASRDIEDATERLNRLVEQLTLPSARARLRRQLQKLVISRDRAIADLRPLLTQFESKERELKTAISHAVQLDESGTFVVSLLNDELKDATSKAEYNAENLVILVTERKALVNVLSELAGLEVVAKILKQSEDALILSEKMSSTEMERVRGLVLRLRDQYSSLAAAFAEKLIESGMSDFVRFGSFDSSDGTQLTFNPDPASSYYASAGDPMLYEFTGSDFDTEVWLPALLPWPPPNASSRVVLDRERFKTSGSPPVTLGDLDTVLQTALAGAGYAGCSYWGVPGGFAIVTPLEQTSDNGTPLPGRARWLVAIKEMKSFTLTEYLKALITAPPGYFRILVFVTTTEPFATSGSLARLDTIERWSEGGLNYLPDSIRAEPLTEQYRTTVMVYEFLKLKDSDKPETSIPGRLAAPDHLNATKLASLVKG